MTTKIDPAAHVRPIGNALLDGKGGDVFANLYARWQDEREYEDFAEYAKVAKTIIPADCAFVSMTKRPFALTMKHTSGALIRLTQTARFGKVDFQIPISKPAPVTPAPVAAPAPASSGAVAVAAQRLNLTPERLRAALRKRGINVSKINMTADGIVRAMGGK